MFVLRDVSADDLDDLHAAARHLDSVNLPDDRAYLASLIEVSTRSFAGENDLSERRFVFVLVDQDAGRVIGASSIFARHGTPRAPHIFFDVIDEQRYSETLDIHVAHRVLRIGYDYQGLTEIGGLVLLPEYRRHPEQLGRLLSYVRFLFIARHRAVFCDEVVSELMPPLEPDGTSLLWESLGKKFTGLTYQEADRLSHKNKEFIRALFPQDPLYVTLLPTHVQALVGQVGPKTKGVEKMLREIGFEYAHRIDPFDGGPHFHAGTDDITLVAATRTARVGAGEPPAGAAVRRALVARERAKSPRFAAVKVMLPATTATAGSTEANDGTLALPSDARDALGLKTGEAVALLPF